MRLLITILIIVLLVIPTRGYTYPLEFQNVDGHISKLQDYEGDFVLIEIMTTWCEVCKAEMQELKQVSSSINSEITLISIGVDLETDTIDKLKQYQSDYEATWTFGLDHRETFKSTFSVDNYPSLIFLGNTGSILKKWTGFTSANIILEEIDNYIDIDYTIQDQREVDFREFFDNNLMVPIFMLLISLGLVYKTYIILYHRNLNKSTKLMS